MMIPCRFLIASIEPRPCGHEGCTEPQPHMVDATVFRLPDGTEVETAPGDVYIEPWSARRQEREGTHSCQWDNCDGRHVICLVPDKDDPHGHPWNVDGRATNCTMVEDRLHRCWVRHGAPDTGTLHVDKGGLTCNAGAGSIQIGEYHGHLQNFALT